MNNKLEFLRNRNNMLEKEVASAIGVDSSVYCKWEHGTLSIPTKWLIKIADYYHVNIDYILNLTDTKLVIKHKELNRELTAKRTKEVRSELKITLDEIAKLLNTTKSTWWAYENNVTLILGSFIYPICKKSGISADYILGRSNTKYIK